MHELSIVRALIEEVSEQARKNKIKVNKIYISLKEEGHLTEESIKFHFEVLKKETLLENAILEIEKSSQLESGLIITKIEGEKDVV